MLYEEGEKMGGVGLFMWIYERGGSRAGVGEGSWWWWWWLEGARQPQVGVVAGGLNSFFLPRDKFK